MQATGIKAGVLTQGKVCTPARLSYKRIVKIGDAPNIEVTSLSK